MKTKAVAIAAMLLPLAALGDASYTEGVHSIDSAEGAISVSGKTELHITSAETPMENAAIDLADDDSWLFFHAFKPSVVLADYLQYVTIGGQPASYPDNVRLGIYGSGCVVIPNGTATDQSAITVYAQPNCKGEGKTLEIHTYHNDLGDWDNKIMSFKLRRGYMATLANNANGTGHSRCFIADDDDLVCNLLPDGFVTYTGEGDTFDPANAESFVSYVRVFRWEWPGKKGWAGWTPSEIRLADVDSYYTWSADKRPDSPDDGFYAMDYEYVPIKQQRWWPGWDQIDGMTYVSHLLGYNEPDHAQQANIDFATAIDQWPYMFHSGLRLGSPATTDPNAAWLQSFFHYINLCNYRCDFAVAHIYKYMDANGWIGDINRMVTRSGGRPCWITEYNNGANWTGEPWPGGDRIANEENLEHQREWAEKIIPALDTIPMLERAHFYNWVEDCRAFILDGKLTPAGEIFANHVSVPAYSKEHAYEHLWKIAPPYAHVDADALHENVTISFYDHNGETGKCYNIYRLSPDGYVLTATLTRGVDYEAGDQVSYTEPLPQDLDMTIYYRVQTISYKDTESLSTEALKIAGAPLGKTTVHKVETNGEEIVIEWDPIEGAESYRIKRGLDKNNLRTLESHWREGTIYHDTTTQPETAYYYQVGAQSSWSETTYSSVVRIYSGQLGIGSAAIDEVAVRGMGSSLVIESPVQCDIDIYCLDGRKLRTVEAVAGTTIVNDLPAGMYVVNGSKVVVSF